MDMDNGIVIVGEKKRGIMGLNDSEKYHKII